MMADARRAFAIVVEGAQAATYGRRLLHFLWGARHTLCACDALFAPSAGAVELCARPAVTTRARRV